MKLLGKLIVQLNYAEKFYTANIMKKLKKHCFMNLEQYVLLLALLRALLFKILIVIAMKMKDGNRWICVINLHRKRLASQFPNQINFNFTGIFQIGFNLFRDSVREFYHCKIINFRRIHNYANFISRLNRKTLATPSNDLTIFSISSMRLINVSKLSLFAPWRE